MIAKVEFRKFEISLKLVWWREKRAHLYTNVCKIVRLNCILAILKDMSVNVGQFTKFKVPFPSSVTRPIINY